MICSACGGASPERARFCVMCGRALPRCRACGTVVSAGFRFCPGCGRALAPGGGEGNGEPLDRGVAADGRAGAREPVFSGPARPEAPAVAPVEQERRQVAILFADLVGFTALSERLDPEAVHGLMQEVLTRLAEVVVEHGGYVDKFIGDCLMALFGAPVAHEDDVARAVAAARAIQSRLEGMNAAIQAEHGARLAIRIGINAGLVVAGELGRPGDYTVIGDAVNVASRVQGLARPGSVLVTESVRAAAGSGIGFTPAGSVSVKNRAAPVEVYEVDGVTAPAAARTADPEPGAAGPFVGRAGELERLQAALAEARAGRGSAVWLLAEAGMGKSRLVAELLARAPAEMSVLAGACRGYAAPLYLPFRHWYEQLARCADRLQIGGEADWRHLLPCPDDWDTLRGALFPEGDRPPSDPETARRIAQQAMLALIRALARRTPLLLVVEDLHWADALSRELLGAIGEEVPGFPAMLIATLRPDGAAPPGEVELVLEPLAPAAMEELLRGLLAPGPVSPDAAAWLVSAAQGHPLFLEELVQTLRARGELARQGDTWELARRTGEIPVPDTVRGVLQARLDALDPVTRTVVREAAVLGASFDPRVLRRVTALPDSLEMALEELEAARVLAPDGAPERRQFLQGLTQQVAYESLLVRRRRELHERAAREIEALYPGRESEVVEELAEHYWRAGARNPAVRYLQEAVERAQSLYANDRARELYERVPALLADVRAEEGDEYAAARARAECGLADLESLTGDLDAAIERLQRLVARGEQGLSPEIGAAIRRRLGACLARRGQPEPAEEALAAALALAEATDSIEARREAARAWYQRASLAYRRGQYPAAEEALASSERHAAAASDAALLADAVLLRGLVRYDTGQRAQARADLVEALRQKEAVGDLRGMAAALNNLGNLSTDEARFAEARAEYGRALEIRRRIGHREGIAAAEINLASVAMSLGDWPGAKAHLEAAQRLCEEIGDVYGALAAAANRGRLALEMGEARDARRRLREVVKQAGRQELANLAIDAEIALAEAELALGQTAPAAARAAAARATSEASGDPVLVALATRVSAMASAAGGRSAEAAGEFAAARAAFRSLKQPLEEARTLVRWTAALPSTVEAERLLEEAEQLARSLGAAGELARITAIRARWERGQSTERTR